MGSVILQWKFAVAALLVGFSGALGWCSTPGPVVTDPAIVFREESLRRAPVRASEFTPLSQALALPRCGDTRPPEALATPDPLWQPEGENLRVRVSFVVGADGRVHSPFILESGGPAEDQMVLHAIRRWRYRPALCNGVPTDSDARVQFSIR
jgi:TonB family protein